MATIYQVSELAGVSLATVSRVMNNNAKVSDKTRKKVLDAMATLDYRPNAIAQSLASNRSNSVGILVSELDGSFYGTMLSGMDNALRRAGKHAIVTAGHNDETDEIEGIQFLISRGCDALILHSEALSDDYLIQLAKGKVPVVLINRLIPEIAENCLYLNNEYGGYLSTKAILEKSHQNIAYISGPLWKRDANDRFTGHKKALNDFNISFNDHLFYQGDFSEESGIEGVKALLASGEPFSALVCANDIMASGAIEQLREQGLNIPLDVSVVGFDNISFSRYLYPRLSTVNYPVYDMGVMAARWVKKNVYGMKAIKITNMFTPELVLRDSIVDHSKQF